MTLDQDFFAPIRRAGTSAPNYELDTADIIARLTKWQALCTFEVTGATDDTIELKFASLPVDLEAFTQDLYEFCPDLVDQGTDCVADLIEQMDGELSPELQKLIEGIDLTDQNYGLAILQRSLKLDSHLTLWWD
ncbi:MAG: DUF4253 domain-containing protein [Pseudanabaenaceae cyanobacterium bins.68]|nr:DUF4253 domain-containing protein [Pseudanabaenaceae cyanobacterium bins.68]